jgi:hypothetical protein
MRIIILHDGYPLGAEQPRVIDVTPRPASIDRPWWYRTRATLVVLLAVVAFPILWMIAGLAVLALAGLGALGLAAFWLRQRLIATRGLRAATENGASSRAAAP